MADTKTHRPALTRYDRPSEALARKNTEFAPWHDEGRNANDSSQHRRYHSLFEDLMN